MRGARRGAGDGAGQDAGAGHRHLRLQGLILEELRSLLRDDVSDPALTGVRITAVVLSVDYRQARVHFALLEKERGEDGEEVARARGRSEQALGRATALLRARLAEAIEMKRVPDLRFVLDGVLEGGEQERQVP